MALLFATFRLAPPLLCLLCTIASAQSISELRKLPKDTLVNMAIRKIDYPSFDVSAFDQISVWMNNKSGQFEVKFDKHLYFVPATGKFLYAVYMDLISGQFGASVMGSGTDDEPKIFKPTPSQTSEIEFVVSKIVGEKRVSQLFADSKADGHVTVFDKDTNYLVSIETPNESTSFTIDKTTGEINTIRTWYKEVMSRPRDNVRIY